VPDPDEGMTSGKRRYQIWLKSETGAPIDVYLVSQEPDFHPEDESDTTIQDILPTTVQPTTPSKKPTPMSPGEPTIDATGLLKLGSPLPVDPDYYLNMYQTEGISDFYTSYDDTSAPLDGEEEILHGKVL